MPATLTVRDETTFSGDEDRVFEIEVPAEHLTARDLIEARVTAEVESYNSRSAGEVFRGLIQPSQAERTLNGFRLLKRRKIDAAEQRERALEAFYSNGFILLGDDRQVMELDEEIVVRPETEVSFLKLVPLVGG
jgi:hypothetical protein